MIMLKASAGEPGLAMLPGVAGGAGFEEGRFAKVPGFESLAAMFFGGPCFKAIVKTRDQS